jgi:hypothetical protein
LRSSTAVLLVAFCSLACAGGAWERVRNEDTVAAYYGYLRDHPDSDYAVQARARLALVRLRNKPTAEGYDAFRAEFPDPALLSELQPIVEPAVFERTRAVGSPEAYREFLEDFPAGENAPRAQGNLAFLEAKGFGARPAELAAFARQYPASDFAAEARRSAEAVSERSQTSFRSVGLRVEIAPGTPTADRLVRAFSQRALERYAAAGLDLIPLADDRDPRSASLPVRLTIRHEEAAAHSDFAGGRATSSGILATTRVTLTRVGDADPIWSDEFSYRVSGSSPGAASVLFGAGSQRYWSTFFVPVATWDTSAAVRRVRGMEKPIASVATAGSRAIVLFSDGDLEMFDVGDPEQPVLLGEYRHKRDLTQWSGLTVAGDRIAIFGPDGIELLALIEGRFTPVLALDRGAVGTIIAVESLGRELVAAGSRGLLLFDVEGRRELLLDRPLLGLARHSDRLLFTDGTSLFVSTAALLRQKQVEAELRLGRGFGPGALRVDGGHAIVMAQRGVAVVDLSIPSRPQLRSRIETAEAGEIRDAALVAGRLFLLGERGLQLADVDGTRVVDSACVATRLRFAPAGRHLVMVGEKSLQVADATPFVAGAAAASPSH